MSCFRRLYDCRNSSVTPSRSHHYHLGTAPKISCCTRVVSWILSRPSVWGHAVYNAVQLAKKKELSDPILDSVDLTQPITPFPMPNMMLYIVHTGMGAFLKQARNNPKNGFFEDKVNHEVFLPILSDIVEASDQFGKDGIKKRAVDANDFLFTCLPEQAQKYRKVILEMMGPQHLKGIRDSLEDLSVWISHSIPEEGWVHNADDFCGEFTAAAISRLFLNHPGPRKVYQEIHWAMTRIDKLAMQKRWGKLSSKETGEYQKAIRIISDAIRIAESDDRVNSFVGLMRSERFTDIQIKGMLFLVYLAGSGTTTTAMKYLLWQLGRHSEHQEAIRNASGAERSEYISKAIAEALRLAPPVGIIGRFAARDLTFTITEKGRTIYSYNIPKGAGILLSPLVAAKQQDAREDFNPELAKSASSFPWLPFSGDFHGCPGKSLALAELSIFVSKILRDYTITSYPKQRDLKRYQFMSLYHPEKVGLQFTRNN